jgi:DNA ligase D-like protein (predicted 3'-phosphoesterase)
LARRPTFVVQKHAATSLHYDFRLEVGRVLRSWAVPKGPSLDPAHRRLAMEVEDHPKSWAKFEGVIGPGYGAGAVIVWDRGTYENLSERGGKAVSMAEALADGHAAFRLHGEKLRGAWSLRRMDRAGRSSWLLNKRRDEEARPDYHVTDDLPASVVSGRLIEDLAE